MGTRTGMGTRIGPATGLDAGRTAGLRTAWLILALFTLLAGDAWRYTISWWGFGALALAIGAGAVVLLIADRERWRFGNLPYPLLAFLALAIVSLAWSHYRGATALGLFTTLLTTVVALAIAVSFTWEQFLRGLGNALRIILAGSLLFELAIAVFVRRPVLPLWVDYGTTDNLPALLYWSRNDLFDVLNGGRIQGLVGNASTLGFMCLLAAIVFGIQLAARTVRPAVAISWLVVTAVVLVCTRSATIAIALVAVALVLAAVLALRRLQGRVRLWATVAVLVAAAGGVLAAILARGALLDLLGKSDDLTNRVDIWVKVIELAQQRPAAGWGWVSYWPPWVAPFDDLILVNRVQVMHAHNAWLDVWLQLGILGLIVFGALVLSTTVRAWLFAVDRPLVDGEPSRYRAIELLPLLLLVALLVQSLAESRILVEYGWMLLVVIAVKTRAWVRLGSRPAPRRPLLSTARLPWLGRRRSEGR